MTDFTASCLKPGDAVYHMLHQVRAVVSSVQPRKDGPGFYVVVESLDMPQGIGVIGDPPEMYWCHPEDLDVVKARRET